MSELNDCLGDVDLHRDAYQQAQRIIRISD